MKKNGRKKDRGMREKGIDGKERRGEKGVRNDKAIKTIGKADTGKVESPPSSRYITSLPLGDRLAVGLRTLTPST